MRRAQQEKLRQQENKGSSAEEEKDKKAKEPEKPAEEAAPAEPKVVKKEKPPKDLLGFDKPAENPPAQGSGMDLLSLDEPPPPMDFTKELNTSALPELRSFDPTMCEKPPLPASVAA